MLAGRLEGDRQVARRVAGSRHGDNAGRDGRLAVQQIEVVPERRQAAPGDGGQQLLDVVA